MNRTKTWGCLVVPAWKGAPWRVELVATAKEQMYVGRMCDVLQQGDGGAFGHAQRWGIEAFVLGGRA